MRLEAPFTVGQFMEHGRLIFAVQTYSEAFADEFTSLHEMNLCNENWPAAHNVYTGTHVSSGTRDYTPAEGINGRVLWLVLPVGTVSRPFGLPIPELMDMVTAVRQFRKHPSNVWEMGRALASDDNVDFTRLPVLLQLLNDFFDFIELNQGAMRTIDRPKPFSLKAKDCKPNQLEELYLREHAYRFIVDFPASPTT